MSIKWTKDGNTITIESEDTQTRSITKYEKTNDRITWRDCGFPRNFDKNIEGKLDILPDLNDVGKANVTITPDPQLSAASSSPAASASAPAPTAFTSSATSQSAVPVQIGNILKHNQNSGEWYVCLNPAFGQGVLELRKKKQPCHLSMVSSNTPVTKDHFRTVAGGRIWARFNIEINSLGGITIDDSNSCLETMTMENQQKWANSFSACMESACILAKLPKPQISVKLSNGSSSALFDARGAFQAVGNPQAHLDNAGRINQLMDEIGGQPSVIVQLCDAGNPEASLKRFLMTAWNDNKDFTKIPFPKDVIVNKAIAAFLDGDDTKQVLQQRRIELGAEFAEKLEGFSAGEESALSQHLQSQKKDKDKDKETETIVLRVIDPFNRKSLMKQQEVEFELKIGDDSSEIFTLNLQINDGKKLIEEKLKKLQVNDKQAFDLSNAIMPNIFTKDATKHVVQPKRPSQAASLPF